MGEGARARVRSALKKQKYRNIIKKGGNGKSWPRIVTRLYPGYGHLIRAEEETETGDSALRDSIAA